jgi:hypothetical protein
MDVVGTLILQYWSWPARFGFQLPKLEDDKLLRIGNWSEIPFTWEGG